MVEAGAPRGDLTALLDAAIIATGTGVVAAVFVVDPITQDSTLNLAGKIVSSAYPIMDVLLIGLLVRLWVTPGARTVSVELLTAALAVNLLADVLWNASVVTTGSSESWVGIDMLWLTGYVLVAAAAWVPSMRDASEPLPEREPRIPAGARLVILAGGLVLPAVTLLIDGVHRRPDSWLVTGVASIALTLLVLARMAGLLNTVQVQAVQLAALARADSLTGAPNRRTWDHELSRACQTQPRRAAPRCASRWSTSTTSSATTTPTATRPATCCCARPSRPGREPARSRASAGPLRRRGVRPAAAGALAPSRRADRIDQLRGATPDGQTFSAGVALVGPRDRARCRGRRGRRRALPRQAGRPRPRRCSPDSRGRRGTAEAAHRAAADRRHRHRRDRRRGGAEPVRGRRHLAALRGRARLGRGAGARDQRARRRARSCAVPAAMLALNITLDTLVTARGHELLPEDLQRDHPRDHRARRRRPPARHRRGPAAAAAARLRHRDRRLGQGPLQPRPDAAAAARDHQARHEPGAGPRARPTTARSSTAITSLGRGGRRRRLRRGHRDVEQRAELAALGVHLGQGYLFGRPEVPRIDNDRHVRRRAGQPVRQRGESACPPRSIRRPEPGARGGPEQAPPGRRTSCRADRGGGGSGRAAGRIRGPGSSPSRTAMESASSFECAPSLADRFEMWLRTVCTLTVSLSSDRCVREPVGQQAEHLTFTLGQLAAGRRTAPLQPRQQAGQHLGRDHRLTRGGGPDGRGHLGQAAASWTRSRRAGLDRGHEHVVGCARGQDHDAGARPDRAQVLDRRDAVPVRKPVVEEHDVRCGRRHHRLGAGRACRPRRPSSAPGWASSTSARLEVRISWSSTISTRIGLVSTVSPAVLMPSTRPSSVDRSIRRVDGSGWPAPSRRHVRANNWGTAPRFLMSLPRSSPLCCRPFRARITWLVPAY